MKAHLQWFTLLKIYSVSFYRNICSSKFHWHVDEWTTHTFDFISQVSTKSIYDKLPLLASDMDFWFLSDEGFANCNVIYKCRPS
jgi:hypothetical protein